MIHIIEEVVKNHPLAVVVGGLGIYWIFKNHIFATPSDLKDNKSKCEKEIIEKLKKDKIFVTPEELQHAILDTKTEVKNSYLTIEVFKEFRRNIDNQFHTVFARFNEGSKQMEGLRKGIDEIKDFLMRDK